MKKIKELMKGKRRITFNTVNGIITVVKELAHWFDEELEEHYCYIYKIIEINKGEYKEYYL